MSKTKISEFDANPDNNTDIDGINIAESCPPANINNAIRELMAQLKDFQAGTVASNQLAAAGGGTGLAAPGTSGNVLTSTGSAWASSVPTYVPTGGLLMWATASAPTGYLLCNGATISRTTYSALFAVVGTTFGVGDGSTTFGLPDFRDRFPVGAGTTYSANASGGSADSIAVSHTHTATSVVTDPGHTHSIQYNYGNASNPGEPSSGETLDSMSASTASGTTGVTVATTVATAGSSGTNANLPPYRGIYFVIKT